jgi:hypothetical protein
MQTKDGMTMSVIDTSCTPPRVLSGGEEERAKIQMIIDARHAVAEVHCKANGWSIEHLTVAQVLEIRALPEWKDAGMYVVVELSAEDSAKIRREPATLSAGYTLAKVPEKIADDATPRSDRDAPGYEFRQHSIRANYFALMPDGSLETVLDGRVVYRETDLVKHWDFRRQQRVNRKRRAARKSKRGWV